MNGQENVKKHILSVFKYVYRKQGQEDLNMRTMAKSENRMTYQRDELTFTMMGDAPHPKNQHWLQATSRLFKLRIYIYFSLSWTLLTSSLSVGIPSTVRK